MYFLHDNVGRHSAVGIATRYGLDSPGIESRWGRNFPHPPSLRYNGYRVLPDGVTSKILYFCNTRGYFRSDTAMTSFSSVLIVTNNCAFKLLINHAVICITKRFHETWLFPALLLWAQPIRNRFQPPPPLSTPTADEGKSDRASEMTHLGKRKALYSVRKQYSEIWADWCFGG